MASRGKRRYLGDRVFRWVTAFGAVVLLLVVLGIFVQLLRGSSLAIARFGFGFLTSQRWNPAKADFGAASSIFGTMVSTAIALAIAVPLAVAIALLLVELLPQRISLVLGHAVELLAAIPSIIFGMWGLFVLAPVMSEHLQPALGRAFGGLGIFQGPPMGVGMLTAGVVIALMVLPYITAVMRDVLKMVPGVLKEGAYGMGATTWEVTRHVTIPHGIHGLAGAVLLGLGRAIGETMAVTFVIGNRHQISASLFAPGNSIASTLANEFTEAAEPIYRSALVELGLLLFGITFLLQVAAQLWLRRLKGRMGATP